MVSRVEPDRTAQKKVLIELALLSIVSLFLELLIVRWTSNNFRAFAIFKTFPLVTCFIGLGVGFAARDDRIFKYAPVAMLIFVAVLKVFDALGLGFAVLPAIGLGHVNADESLYKSAPYIGLFMVAMVVLLGGPFAAMACIGARLASLFNQLKPLPAYVVNLGGAIIGSLLFSITSFSGLSPDMLMLPVCAIFYYYLRNYGKLGWKALIPLLAVSALCFWDPNRAPGAQVYWSPYQRVEVQPFRTHIRGTVGDTTIGYRLRVNRTFYQFLYDLSEKSATNPDLPDAVRSILSLYRSHYVLPYRFVKPKDVLVIGAGTGNDVAEAVREGAQSVDAVDIDPVILRLGKEIHPAHQYDSPVVHRFCDDARHYMNSCKKKYDLVVFAQLDSQTGIGQGASMRLDNYVFTRESIRKASELLQPDGLVCLSFANVTPWLQEKLYETVKAAVGYPPIVIEENLTQVYFATNFLIGKSVQDGSLKIPDGLKDMSIPWRTTPPKARVLTDDWPYLYLAPIAVDVPYLIVVAEVLLVALIAGRRVLFARRDGLHWQLFFMGAAFILLELQSIARLALVYGSTALTSASVITGVLVMIFLSTIVVLKNAFDVRAKQPLLYGLLLATLIGSYFLPTDQVLAAMAGMPLAGALLVTLITVLPMFVAGMIFAVAFASVSLPGPALAFNLLGAVLGSMLEYLSNYIGINGLVIVAAGLYTISFLCHSRHASANST